MTERYCQKSPTFVVILFEQLQLLLKAALRWGYSFADFSLSAFQLICLTAAGPAQLGLKLLHTGLQST